jgi:cytosine/adenosine deaminase-related metal-dependent hydrolase
VKKLVEFQEVIVSHSTDIARLKKDAASISPSSADSDAFVVYNATLITMESGNINDDLIHDAVVVTRGGIIEFAGPSSDATIPRNAASVNAHGGRCIFNFLLMKRNHCGEGFVVPGFIDVHAHWNGFGTLYPAKSWEMETFLAYGVTTLHKYVPKLPCAGHD